MVHLLIDLQESQILSDTEISSFLNNNSAVQLAFAHLMNRFHQFHATVGIFYPKFKEDFIKEPSPTFQISGILKCEKIFFNLLLMFIQKLVQ
jgi:hypothetical protein